VRQAEEIERQRTAAAEAATAAVVAAALAEAEAERNACAHTLREEPTAAAERMSQMRAWGRAARVEAGADLPPPLAPIEHRRLLKEGRAILGGLDFERLKNVVAYATVPTIELGASEHMVEPVEVEATHPAPDIEPTAEQYRFAYFNRANDAMRFAFWPDGAPKPDQEMVDWAQNVIEIWTELRAKLAERIAAPTIGPDERYRNRKARRAALQREAA
jgi:hypothetical protein